MITKINWLSLIVLFAFFLISNIASAQEAAMQDSIWKKQLLPADVFGACSHFLTIPKGSKKQPLVIPAGIQPIPAYEEVSSGTTGHAESIQVEFDPKVVSYEKILDIYWHNIDPTQINGQFVDEGTQYRTVIFYHNDEQKRMAERSKKALDASGRFDKPIVTQILPATTFYPAEDYHQKYYLKKYLSIQYVP